MNKGKTNKTKTESVGLNFFQKATQFCIKEQTQHLSKETVLLKSKKLTRNEFKQATLNSSKNSKEENKG